MHLTAKQAAKIACEYVIDVIGPSVPVAQVMPEEIEVDPEGKIWSITVGYATGPMAAFYKERSYKTIDIADQSGEVMRMKIRPV